MATERIAEMFPPGTPVVVTQSIHTLDRHREPTESRFAGVVVEWEVLPTGSWFAHGKNDRLWLQRLRLCKADGELTLIIVDDLTRVARLEAAKS